MGDIALTDLTNATTVLDGTGVFDKLMMAVNIHILEQWEQGRLVGSDYAAVYVGAIQSTISESIRFLLEEQSAGLQADKIQTELSAAGFMAQAKLDKEMGFVVTQDGTNPWEIDNISAGSDGLVDAQIAEQLAATGREGTMNTAKISLVGAQTLGFKSDTKQKVLRQMLESWSVAFSVAPDTPIPTGTIGATQIDALKVDILDDLP